MCEYSLHSVPNRLAIEGEQLVTHRFATHSMGLASPAEVEASKCAPCKPAVPQSRWARFMGWLNPPQRAENITAVCIPPGARLLVSQIPKRIRSEFDIGAVEEVTFVQLSAEAYQYRDATRFRTGRTLLLQYFDEGVRFKVLSLACSESQEPELETEWAWRPPRLD